MKHMILRTMSVIMAVALLLSVEATAQAQGQGTYQLASIQGSHPMQWSPGTPLTFSGPSASQQQQQQSWHNQEMEVITAITDQLRIANERVAALGRRMDSFEATQAEFLKIQQETLLKLEALEIAVRENTELSLAAKKEAIVARQEAMKNLALAQQAWKQAQAAKAEAARAQGQANAAYAESEKSKRLAAQALAYARKADEAAKPKGFGKILAFLIPGLRHK